MSFKSVAMAAVAAFVLTGPALAGDAKIMVKDAYARASTPTSKSGAAFMMLMNQSDQADRLIAARTDSAKRTELHTHEEDGDGVMRMIHVEEGFEIPAGGMHMLQRGGDHVMLMGLTEPMAQGETVTLILTFEKAGEMTIEVPVDLARKAGAHSH